MTSERRTGRRARGWVGAVLVALLAPALLTSALLSPAMSQDEEDEGLQAAPGSAKSVVAAAVEAMGGAAKLDAVRTALLRIETEGGAITERHSLRLEGRFMHYASRGEGGAGFDVVIAGPAAFICDRAPDGHATYVQDLEPADAREGAYERDLLFMPLLLSRLAADARASLEHKGKNSVGEDVVKATVNPAAGNTAEPFVIRLRFAPDTHLLAGAMGTIPCGADQGKKRYLGYLEPREVGGVRLPSRLSDARGHAEAAREYGIAWELDPALDPALWTKPSVPAAPARGE